MSPRSTSGRMRPLLSGVVLRSQSDARLVALAADGSAAAFTVIFERHARDLRAHAARLVRPSRVDDVLQHTMLSAWNSLLAGAEIDHLRPWLHRIVHNTALNATVKRGYDDRELPQTVAAATLTEELVQGRLSAGEALAAIAALPQAQRQALTLTAIDGHSARDAAAEMGVSENALRQLVYRARTSMRSAVSAVTPLPLVLAAATSGTAGPATLAGAGALGGGSIAAGTVAAGSGSAALKVAAVLAIAAGTAGTTTALHHDPPAQHATSTRSARPAVARAPQLTLVAATRRPAQLVSAAHPLPRAWPGAVRHGSTGSRNAGSDQHPGGRTPPTVEPDHRTSDDPRLHQDGGDGSSDRAPVGTTAAQASSDASGDLPTTRHDDLSRPASAAPARSAAPADPADSEPQPPEAP